MLRTHWVTNPSAAKAYFKQTSYYASYQAEWLGKGAEILGLSGTAHSKDFDKLCDNLDPRTGELLRPRAHTDGRVGMDLTFNSTKSVGIARELAGPNNAGDGRIEEAHREAVAYVMGILESEVRTRVRVGGKNEDRVTGNTVAYRVTHRDTRINAEDRKPDMELHDHVFVLNCTYDAVESKWKAAQMGQIKHDAPYYEAIYHNRLASNLRDLGYGITRKGKSFEISGISDALVRKFSRRRQYIKAVAEKLGITSAAGMDKLGATTRLGKAKETIEELREYFAGRLTGDERQALGTLIGRPCYESSEIDAVRYAIGHHFERQSVVDERRLYEAAIRYGIGSVTPESIETEAKRQGLLVKGGESTTREVLAEERRVINFAREGRGRFGPLTNDVLDTAFGDRKLSREQQAICRHVWDSRDQVILIRGAAGTGKTRTMRTAIDAIDRPVVVLAPSAQASRGVLRSADGGGFDQADTVARFLVDDRFQQKAKGGVIWVDEAGLQGIRQLREVFDIADRLGARVVLQGDRRQHASVERGSVLRVLEEFGGVPVAELRNIRRQSGDYKRAAAALAKGDILAGYDILAKLGWIRQTENNAPLVDEYVAALDARKTVLVVAPTHIEGEEITAELRARLKEQERIGKEEKQFDTLVPLGWTDAEKGDVARYEGTEVMHFHRSSGCFKAGDQIRVTDWKKGNWYRSASHFAVYAEGRLSLAVGDAIRVTANGKTLGGRHRLNNGSLYQVKGFDRKGNIILANDWVVAKDFGHLTHGYVTTSHAAQGKTVERVLIAMGRESAPAINAEQFYVSVTRGRESARIFTGMAPDEIRQLIKRSDRRKSATEFVGHAKPRVNAKSKDKLREFMHRMAKAYRQLRERASAVLPRHRHEQELSYER